LAGLDPARLPVVVADQAIDAAASFARNEAKRMRSQTMSNTTTITGFYGDAIV
jgi:hypothetical protein